MVWAIARKAPIKAYFEFEAHPEPRIQYTARLESARIKRMLRLMSAVEWGRGIGTQRVKASISESMGAARKRMLFEVRG